MALERPAAASSVNATPVVVAMPTIEFEQLTLRAFDDADATDFVTAVRESVETVGRWMSWCHVGYDEAEALDWFAIARDGSATGDAHEFGVFETSSGALVGGAGLNLINRQHLYCNLGYWVRQSRQREGIATRCVRALIPHAFGALGLRRVEIVVAEGNRPSEGVARRCGAIFEVVAHNRVVIGDRSMPASIFSIIPETTDEVCDRDHHSGAIETRQPSHAEDAETGGRPPRGVSTA